MGNSIGRWRAEMLSRRNMLRLMGLSGAAAVSLGEFRRPTSARSVLAQSNVSCKSGSKKVVWMVRNDPDENRWENNFVRPAFIKQYPDLCLDVLSVKQEDVAVKRQAMLAAHDKLHVWSPAWGGNGFASDMTEGFIEDLTPFIQRDKLDTSIFLETPLKTYQRDGKQYGLPILTLGSYVFYNKKLFDEAKIPYPTDKWDDPSWTWDAFIDLAKQLTKNYDNPDKAQYGAFADVVDTDVTAPPLIWGHNIWPEGAYETGFADKVTLTDDRSVAAFQAFHDSIYKDKVSPNPAVTDALKQLGGPLPSGRVAMEIQGGWYLWTLKGLMDDPNGFCWGIAPMPIGAPDAKIRNITFTDPWVMTSGMSQEDQDLAWTLIKFLVSPDQAKEFMVETGTPPTQSALYEQYFSLYSKCTDPASMRQVFEGAFTHGMPEAGAKMVGFDQMLQIWTNVTQSYFADPGAKAKDVAKELEDQTSAKLRQIKASHKK